MKKKEKVIFFFLLMTHKEGKLRVFSRTIIWALQPQRVEVFKVEDLATGSKWKILLLGFVVKLYILDVLLYFPNLL